MERQKQEFQKLAPQIISSIQNLKSSGHGNKTTHIQITSEPNQSILLSSSDLNKGASQQKINKSNKIEIEDFVSRVMVRAISEINDEKRQKDMNDRIAKFLTDFKSAILSKIDSFQKIIVNVGATDQKDTAKYFFSTFLYSSDKEKIKLIECLAKQLAYPLVQLTDSSYIIKENLNNYLQQLEESFQHILDKVEKISGDKILALDHKISLNSMNLELNSPYKIFQMEKGFPWCSKGIAVHPKEIGKYLVYDKETVRCIKINHESLNKIFEISVNNKGGTYDDTVDYSTSGEIFLITRYNASTLLIYHGNTGNLINEIQIGPKIMHAKWICFDKLITGDYYGNIKLIAYNSKNFQVMPNGIQPSASYVRCILPDQTKFFFYFGNGIGNLYKIGSINMDIVWSKEKVQSSGIYTIAKLEDYIAVGSYDYTFALLKESNQEIVYRSDKFGFPLMNVTFSPRGEYLLITTTFEILVFQVEQKKIVSKINQNLFEKQEICSTLFDWKTLAVIVGLKNGLVFSLKMCKNQ